MRRALAFLLVAFVVAGLTSRANGQDRVDLRSLLSEESRESLREEDPAIAFRTREYAGGRYDLDSGVMRSAYQLNLDVGNPSSPEQAGRAFVAGAGELFGWASGADLELVETRESPGGYHLTYQQMVSGVPVMRARVKVSLDRDLQPTIAFSSYSVVAAGAGLSTSPTRTASDIDGRLRQLLKTGSFLADDPKLIVYPGPDPRLAWVTMIWPSAVAAEIEVIIDDRTGDVLLLRDQRTHRNRDGHAVRHAPISSPLSPARSGSATGTGLVFDPDPLTTSGSSYGPPYVDANDSDVEIINNERITVDLLDIAQGTDGRYRLEGSYATVVGRTAGGANVYTPPSEALPDAFQYTRSHDGFEAVMAYYHIDKSQRYVQSLGFSSIQNGPIDVNPQALTSDDSFYTPSINFIEFGTGGVDDGEDASVIWHEYGHALLNGSADGLLSTAEGQALHEGWSDYWSSSYLRGLVDAGASKRSDWASVFKWDSGDGQIWAGRKMDKVGVYPDATRCEDSGDSNGDGCNIYEDGRLWATAIMELYTELGKQATDRLNLQSHQYLSVPVTFRDAAQALLQADRDLFNGVNGNRLVATLGARGLLDQSQVAPIVSHEPLRDTEQIGGTTDLAVDALGVAGPISSVVARYSVDGGALQELQLARDGASDTFSADLGLPSAPSEVAYFVEVMDTPGNTVVLPTGAPVERFRFQVGPDVTPPTINHTPISSASPAIWPVEVIASVDDNLGVGRAWVSYRLDDPNGATVEQGSFDLNDSGSDYRAAFPISPGVLEEGSTIAYVIFAEDAALAKNQTSDPGVGEHLIEITLQGVLAIFDFESASTGVEASGVWERGTPAFGLRVAHSGQSAWGTDLEGAYPTASGKSSLTLPAYDFSVLSEVYLVFWHWYDLEHDGSAEPGVGGAATLWDGGNVKVSVDGGSTWSVVTPEGGYDGTVATSGGNPLGSEAAYGGYSYGWRQAIVALPQEADVRIRFEAGTDGDNTQDAKFYAGWFIDDVSITTVLPEDSAPPRLVLPPPDFAVHPTGGNGPGVSVKVTDDTGAEGVFVDYSLSRGPPEIRGTVRLAMAGDDVTVYEGLIDAGVEFVPGDLLSYTVRARDFAGNERTFDTGSGPFVVELRLAQTIDLLDTPVATGGWQRAAGGWVSFADADVPGMSALVLAPIILPTNAVDVSLVLSHEYLMGTGRGGQVQLSVDDGATWAAVEPEGGYPMTLSASGHPMDGTGVFSGASGGTRVDIIDVSSHAGEALHLRVVYADAADPSASDFWSIARLDLSATSTASAFEVPEEVLLYTNFPNPFSGTTNVRYTTAERGLVWMAVYDTVGRLVRILVNGEKEAGTHATTFDATGLSAGVYFVSLRASGRHLVEKMVVLP